MLFQQNLTIYLKKNVRVIEKAHSSDDRVTNISTSFTHKMAAKTSWHRYGTKLRHCHPMSGQWRSHTSGVRGVRTRCHENT